MIAKNRKPAPPSASTFRCAVYTRKSTEDGLDQAFNSLDARAYSNLLRIHGGSRLASITATTSSTLPVSE